MKRIGIWSIVLGFSLLAGTEVARAHEGHEATAPGERVLTGEVVDVMCYLSHGAEGLGPAHAGCGKKCIQSGLPVAIKVGDRLYLAAMADHSPANAKLADLTGQQVEVHGTVMEKDGQHLIAISSIEKAVGAPTAQAKIYTCPMHPEVRQKGPGTCPKCGMALEAR